MAKFRQQEILAQQQRMEDWSCQHGMTNDHDHACDITADVTVTRTLSELPFLSLSSKELCNVTANKNMQI